MQISVGKSEMWWEKICAEAFVALVNDARG